MAGGRRSKSRNSRDETRRRVPGQSSPEKARQFLEKDTFSALADSIIGGEPWLFTEKGIAFSDWSEGHLHRCGIDDSELVLVGSSAIGFSLAPNKLGRPFRLISSSSSEKPSDLDLALVSDSMFEAAWMEFRREDQIGSPRPPRVRSKIYFGHIDDHELMRRESIRGKIRVLVDSIGRDTNFLGHKASIRLYRRRIDLKWYTLRSLRDARKALGS